MRFTIAAGQKYVSPGTITVEGDASSASYFLGGAAITGGPVTVRGCGRDSVQVKEGGVMASESRAVGFLLGCSMFVQRASTGECDFVEAGTRCNAEGEVCCPFLFFFRMLLLQSVEFEVMTMTHLPQQQ